MSKKLKIGLAAIVVCIAVAAILLYNRSSAFLVELFGSDGAGGSGNPRVGVQLKDPFLKGVPGGMPAEPDEEQPPVDPNQKTRVILVFSQMAGVMPEAVGPILRAIGAGKVGQMLSYDGKSGAYTEPGIVQVCKATPTLWTRIRAGLVGAKGIIQAISPESKSNQEGGGSGGTTTQEIPGIGYVNMALSLLGSWQDVCNGARCGVAFEVNADKQNAPVFLLKSGLMEQIRQLEQLTQLAKAAGKKLGMITQVIQVLSTKV